MADTGLFLFEELTREDVRRLAPHSLVVLPVGATEQHGPHLPVGTDFIHTEFIARRAAKIASESVSIVVAPTLPFGSSHHHLPFGGTLSISTKTYYDFLFELVESLVMDGFRAVFIVNGHGGNHELVALVARDVAMRRRVDIAAGSWWNVAWDALVEAGAHEVGRVPGHSGAFETSLIMALRPDLVREPRPHRDDPGRTDPARFGGLLRSERADAWLHIDGYTDSPDLGAAESGSRYVELAAQELARQFISFLVPLSAKV